MRGTVGLMLGVMLAGGCSVSGDDSVDGGTAQVTVGDQTFDVDRVILSYEFGEDGYFRLEGNDADHPDQDCLPGLDGGLALYGDMPAGATSLEDIADMDRDLVVERECVNAEEPVLSRRPQQTERIVSFQVIRRDDVGDLGVPVLILPDVGIVAPEPSKIDARAGVRRPG